MASGGRGTLAVGAAPWPAAAEAAAEEVVRRLRPTEASERRRAEVVAYARRLIGAALGCEVFVYGSVPLKTYLPDGDIDLTILGNTSHNSTLVNDVYCVLDSEEQNIDADFEVKDLDRINAEVRLIKCTIDNIIVDISFNQTGGICALCFLELVDRKVGKNHLFKRSIILIKAWCYYESRLLGAHHGLISTYALEVLILYIFNLFHKSLHGPLEVLYRFLEYFSKFDWDNYCISLNGPVALSALPNLTVEATGIHTDDLLFDKEFLKSSLDEVFVPRRETDQSAACYTRFRPKHLNIIDPLKEYNNLGRSVNRASFHRIRTAFSYGARKLHQVLMLQSELIPNEIYGFFKNTLERNGRGFRPDVAKVGALHPSFGTGKDILEEISSMSISYRKVDQNGSPPDHSKGLDDTGSYVSKGSTPFGSFLPGGHKIASNADIRSSHFVHGGPKQYPLFYQESGNGSNDKYDMDCYVHHETEHLSYCPTKTFGSDDRSLIQSRVHVNNQLPTLNSYANVNSLTTDKKNWRVEKQQLTVLPLRLPDLSGDLDLQFRCLRQVQYHLEYLFDAFLQSVQEASFDDKFQKAPFHIPTLSILLDADAALPGLLLPSSAESNGMELSPVSCSHSTKAISKHSQDEDPWDVACPQNISLPSGMDIPTNEFSPSSSCNDSDSSVSWCYSSEGSPEMHGTDTFFPRESYDTSKQQLAHSKENGKILTNHSVVIETNQLSHPGRSFVSPEEQVALSDRIKEVKIGQPLKVQSLNKKAVEKHRGHPRKGFARHDDNKTREMPKYQRDFCFNTNILLNQQYGTNMEFARASSAIRQEPKYQPFNSIQSTAMDCTSARPRKSLPRKQSYGISKKDEILDWQTRHLPGYESLKLQNQQHGTICSKKYSAGKEHLSFVTGVVHVSCNTGVSILSGMEKGPNAKKFDENGNQLWPLLQEVPPSLHSINSQGRPPISDTSKPSFPITNVPPLQTIEFGSLGPFALASLQSNKVTNKHADRRVLTDASSLVIQRSRTSARQRRSSESCKVVNEDEFPPLNAVVR